MDDNEAKEVLLKEFRSLQTEIEDTLEVATTHGQGVDKMLDHVDKLMTRKEMVIEALTLLTGNKVWWVKEMAQFLDREK